MKHNPQEDIALIRHMMERSTRFISLSGLSGVFAGILALIAYVIALQIFRAGGADYNHAMNAPHATTTLFTMMVLCAATLVAAIGAAFLFTYRKSKRSSQTLMDKQAKRFLFSLAIPLVVGGVFCLALFYHAKFSFIAPSMLLFYGLALVNAEKYTYSDIGYLGYTELALGLIAAFFPRYGLAIWATGFGVMHIIYGAVMYKKYR